MCEKNLSEDKEKLLQTLTRFDGDITVEDVTDGVSTKSHSKHHTFFVQVLLENICLAIESDDTKREVLFSEVYKRLSRAEFLNDSVIFDNFLSLRRKLAKQFFDFVKKIHNEVIPNAAVSNVTAESLLQDVDFDSELDHHGRYEKNFEELEVIAKGGFGVVCKARHKVTDITYAVKKVTFKYTNDSKYLKIIREAKNIGTLSHPNIVTYNNAWLQFLLPNEYDGSKSSSETSSGSEEEDSDTSADQISQCSRDLGALFGKENESQSFEIYFRSAEEIVEQKNTSNNSSRVLKENYLFNSSAFMYSSQDSCYDDNNDDSTLSVSETSYQSKQDVYDFHEKKSSSLNPSFFNVRLMLYIQMEYCDCDLRLWLNRRAEGKELPFKMDVLKIFKDILHGVTHIHSKGIIHRDLKPQNIFYSKTSNVLKIGDFGLATLASCTAGDESGTISSKHSANLGTLPYAAPEQIKSKGYDSKVDIYSLGIILIELLNKFYTEMELVLAIREIHKNNYPTDMVQNWPSLVNLVKNLVKTEPEERMSAKEILNKLDNMEILETNKEIKEEIEILKVTVKEKDDEIELLKAAVKEKDDLIERLKTLVEELQNNIKLKQGSIY